MGRGEMQICRQPDALADSVVLPPSLNDASAVALDLSLQQAEPCSAKPGWLASLELEAHDKKI